MSVYSRVPIYKPGRNKFRGLSHNFRNTINIGEIHLSCRPIEMVPGDTMDFSQVTSVELQPLVHPFKGDLFYESWAFFVSNRICQYDNVYEPEVLTNEPEFEDILLDSANNSRSLPIPILSNVGSPGGEIPVFSYLSETGFPQESRFQTYLETYKICAYPFRGIDLIFKEYFRDENLQQDLEFLSGVPSSSTRFYEGFYLINYKKDRFTGASLSPQKGNPVRLPISGVSHLTKNPDVHDAYKLFTHDNSLPYGDAAYRHGGGLASPFYVANESFVDNLNADFDEVMTERYQVNYNDDLFIYIENFRLADKLQRWNERNMITGTRAKEYYLANYGIAPSDETLQRPAMIGHIKTPVIVNSVLQHEETQDTPLGYKAGNGGTVQSTHFGRWTAKEFGWVIVLSALRPRANYQNQVDRSLIKTSVWDFYNKIFEGLGQEEIYNCEVDAYHSDYSDEPAAGSSPLDVWGYTDRYNYMREMQDLTTGQLLQEDSPLSLPAYATVRKFGNLPSLSEEFIRVNPSEYDYLFAVSHDNLNHAIVSTFNQITAYRPLRKYAHPSLV